jgi:general secretion pathway protein F
MTSSATFAYKAATADGDIVSGVLDGTSRDQVIEQLRLAGHVPIRVDSAPQPTTASRLSGFRRERITEADVGVATRELATLLRAGMPLDRALAVLVLSDVRRQVKEGATLADAMAEHDGVFGRFYLSLLRAGESGGALDTVLARLSEYLERSREMKAAVTSSLMYPAVLVVVAITSILILLGYVVPQFTEMFASAGQALPLSTRITIAIGEALQSYGWVLALVALAGTLVLRKQLDSPRSAMKWHAWALRLPLAGDIIVKREIARFAYTLSVLLANGLPLLNALTIVRDTMGNYVLRDGVERALSGLREGERLAKPLAAAAHFPKLAAHMIAVGEESGDLQRALEQIASTYDKEAEITIKRSLTLLEPALILVLGVVIAAVIISILVAFLGINELVV